MNACDILTDEAIIPNTEMLDSGCTYDILLLLVTEDEIFVQTENEILISLQNG